MKLAALANPGHNRVYFDNSRNLALAELTLATGHEWAVETLGGLPYYTCEYNSELSSEASELLYGLSAVYALFELSGGLLKPVSSFVGHWLDSKICTLMKYSGKTNELFTKLLVNIAVFSYGTRSCAGLSLLDPVAGKGTTLFEALSRGMDAGGMEIAETAAHDGVVFLKKFLESERMKYTFHNERLSGKGFRVQVNKFEISKTKESQKSGDSRRVTIVGGNSQYADAVFGKEKFQLLVGDLPYGVAHGNVTNEKSSALTRNPKQLLAACLPAWRSALKKNGVIVLSWNTFVLPRRDMVKLLSDNGFGVFTGECYDNLSHRVDQAILRDIVVARRS